MLIALNIVMAGLVVAGIVTLLAKSIKADQQANAGRQTVVTTEPAPAHTARTRTRSRAGARPVGAHS